ncbi:MAG: MBL fold metallo-hydrolase [Pyrinomonadaceae bacterium]|nr:MBL fold metallo-hydrolase [Pyrinomonadaceae bacterium]
MIIEEFIVTPFQQNARIIACEKTRQAICIDPGEPAPEIIEAIERHGLNLQAIALTHAHMDHIGGVSWLKSLKPEAEIILHEADAASYHALPEQPAWLGIPRAQWAMYGVEFEKPPAIDRYWSKGEIYAVGELAFKILHCPGHAPGHVVLFEEKERVAIVGDCLFAGSIGRTDLPFGSMEDLMDSIVNKILPLGDDVRALTGHGANTTIGHERLTNPFLTGAYAL